MNMKNLLIISGFLIASSQASSQGIDVNRALDRAYEAISDNFDQSSDSKGIKPKKAEKWNPSSIHKVLKRAA